MFIRVILRFLSNTGTNLMPELVVHESIEIYVHLSDAEI